jgi:hypothetical protein
MRRLWKFSKEWSSVVREVYGHPWPKSENLRPIDRHYYQEPVTEKVKAEVQDRVYRCLCNFSNSEVPNFIAQFDTSTWQGPRRVGEVIPKTVSNALTFWASYDFAIKTPELVLLFDWKAAEASPWSRFRTLEQLRWYALYALIEWSVPIENIRLCPVWLWPEMQWIQSEVNLEEIQDLAYRISERNDVLSERLGSNATDQLNIYDWPMASEIRCCKTCEFRGVCAGYERVPVSRIQDVGLDLQLVE